MRNYMKYIKLMRPANVVTAVADILLGYAASGAVGNIFSDDNYSYDNLIALVISTMGLYAGGVVLNDVCDAKLDAVERPERPIPSGAVSLKKATVLGVLLLVVGIVAAFQASVLSGMIALVISFLVALYNAYGKHQLVFGPLNMGACRGMNVLLGVSAIPAMVSELWFISLISILYIAAITMISRGEVHGGSKKIIIAALFIYLMVVMSVVVLCSLPEYKMMYTLPFLLLFVYLTLLPLIEALKKPKAMEIRKAVKACVLSLIALDAAMAAGFAGWEYGLVVLCLLPISIGLAKFFAVT